MLTTGRVYRGQTPQHRRSERRERLLSAGLELFGTRGYAAATIEQLCSHSRVTTRHFYQEFKNREELLVGVIDRCASLVSHETLSALGQATGSPAERTRQVIEVVFRSLLEDPRRARILVIEAVTAGAMFWPHVIGTKKFFLQLLKSEANRLAEADLMPSKDYHMTAAAIYGAGRQLMVEWLQLEEKPPINELVEEMVGVTLAVAGLGPPSDLEVSA